MKALVTGATGFVGAAVARRVLAAGHEVRALVRKSSNRANLDGLDLEVVTGDITDKASLADAVKGCDALFHVAADYRLWTPDPEVMMRTNVDGSRNAVRAAAEAGCRRIVYTSSVATLGLHGNGDPADEDTPVSFDHMIGAYKQSKFRAEEAVMRLVRDDGAPVVIVNPAAPVGPRDIKPTPTGRMIVDAACGRIPAYVDTGLNIVHVEDVADGHLAAFERGAIGERYILGGDNMALGDILAEIAVLCGRKPPRIRLPHGALLPVALAAEAWIRLRGSGEPFVTVDQLRMARKKMYFRSDKAAEHLDYTPRPAGEAFRDALAWFRENGYLS